jgi:hypothetical protein
VTIRTPKNLDNPQSVDDQIDDFDTDEGNQDAAQGIDEQIFSQNRLMEVGRYFTPRSA